MQEKEGQLKCIGIHIWDCFVQESAIKLVFE